jgi:thymidylate synthase
MKQYHDMMSNVMENGTDSDDRTGVGTRRVFGDQTRYDLRDGFPAVTTKRLAWKAVVGELLWFLEGSTDERRLAELTFRKDRGEITEKKTVWTDNADNQGVALGYQNDVTRKELGPIYGYQWRNFGGSGYDQVLEVINAIKKDSNSRRLIITAWNPADLHKMALPPCHAMIQFGVIDGRLNLHLTQRSADSFLGVPFNIASYALMTHIFARECGLEVGEFVHTTVDTHIYHNHFEQVREQLERAPRSLPTLKIADDFDLMDRLKNGFRLDDADRFTLEGYDPLPAIKAPMAV